MPAIRRVLGVMICGLTLLGVSGSGCSKSDGEKEGADRSTSTAQDSGARSEARGIPQGQFLDYWYSGVAELNSYRLSQARYGSIHEGNAVLIFVTEDFLPEKQVKADNPGGVSVLKLNLVKKFVTGIYPYSMMTSVFTPVDRSAYPHSLKVTTSSQEWCGHTFTQLNWDDPDYRLRQYSYFEKEGDIDIRVKPEILEDEVWTRLRINPEELPVGRVVALPGTLSARLRHTEHVPQEAEARRVEVQADSAGNRIFRYSLEYADPPRNLMIDYRADFPHEIVGWSEQYNDFGEILETKAVRVAVERGPYWSQHNPEDTLRRRDLLLPMTTQ